MSGHWVQYGLLSTRHVVTNRGESNPKGLICWTCFEWVLDQRHTTPGGSLLFCDSPNLNFLVLPTVHQDSATILFLGKL